MNENVVKYDFVLVNILLCYSILDSWKSTVVAYLVVLPCSEKDEIYSPHFPSCFNIFNERGRKKKG